MKLSFQYTLLLLAFSGLFLVGCEEDPPIVDPPIVVPPVPPSLDFSNETGLITNDVTLDVANTLIRIGIEAETGDAELNSLSVSENGTLMNPDNIRIYTTIGDTSTEIDPVNNPQSITGDFRNGFAWEVNVLTPDFGETSTYAFTVTDADGETDEISLSVAAEMPSTPIDSIINGVLFNSDGPKGTGGLDLDEGFGTGSASSLAEIRDLGGIGAGNWRRQIAGVNGSVIKTLSMADSDNFDFTAIDTKEAIIGLFDNGDDLTDEFNGNPATAPIMAGDVFVVFNDTNATYYLIEVAEVNEVDADNSDNYLINIRY